MTREKSFEECYQDNDTPWEIHRPDRNLVDFVSGLGLGAGAAIDLGCGTGDNCVWLASQGFRVTGCDLSDLALQHAEKKARRAGVRCVFQQMDFLQALPPGGPFALAFDRGCFHSVAEGEARCRFAARVAEILEPGGQWLSLIGNLDEERGERRGPPQMAASQIALTVEPVFEILSLQRGYFDSDLEQPHLSWVCHLRKR